MAAWKCWEISGNCYWPEQDGALRDGVFHTSDLVDIFEGKVWLRGRATDQINVAGRKISPESIEKVLLTHPQVEDCLVFGIPSQGPSESRKIAACVVAAGQLEQRRVAQFLLSFLPRVASAS